MTALRRTGAPSRWPILAAALALCGCDESQAVHRPDFSLARMQEQPRVDPFDEGMSAPPPFTVAQGGLAHPPPLVTRALVEHGRRSFETLCAACHGMRGNGHSVVATKMLLRPPPSLLDARIRALSDEQIEGVIAHGYGLMPSYSFALSEDDRYATVAYVRALEVAQGVNVAALPSALAAKLVREAP